MQALIQKILGFGRRKKVPKHDAITGRSNTFPVPYLAKLESQCLEAGHSLVIRGIIIGRQNFSIALTNGPRVEFDETTNELDDRLLLIRVEIDQKKIFLNACIDGEFGKEGQLKHRWHLNDEFDIRIRCHEEEFEIFVDHKLVARFAHYLPLDQISHVFIQGDIELFSSSWEGTYYNVPYAAEIPGNFTPGRKFYVSGLAKKKKQKNFSSNSWPMTITSDFKYMHKLICNTKLGDQWQEPERLTLEPFPFKRKNNFDVLIYCEESKFLVYVDDCLLGSYEHRINPRQIDRIQISGDIVLQGFHRHTTELRT
ncbi:Galectin [Aphelenchoides besseyi]|nr:Galectin [Aphelenchoides besseyi]